MILCSMSVTKELYPKVDLNFRLVTNKTSESLDVRRSPFSPALDLIRDIIRSDRTVVVLEGEDLVGR